MGLLDQMKMAQEMMKNMSPDQVKQMVEQAKQSKQMMEEMVAKIVDEEIRRRRLVSREDVETMIQKAS